MFSSKCIIYSVHQTPRSFLVPGLHPGLLCRFCQGCCRMFCSQAVFAHYACIRLILLMHGRAKCFRLNRGRPMRNIDPVTSTVPFTDRLTTNAFLRISCALTGHASSSTSDRRQCHLSSLYLSMDLSPGTLNIRLSAVNGNNPLVGSMCVRGHAVSLIFSL